MPLAPQEILDILRKQSKGDSSDEEDSEEFDSQGEDDFDEEDDEDDDDDDMSEDDEDDAPPEEVLTSKVVSNRLEHVGLCGHMLVETHAKTDVQEKCETVLDPQHVYWISATEKLFTTVLISYLLFGSVRG
jgi:hypothetical protein